MSLMIYLNYHVDFLILTFLTSFTIIPNILLTFLDVSIQMTDRYKQL